MNVVLRQSSDRPWLTLAGTLALSILALAQIFDLRTGERQLEIDPSPNQFLPAEDPGKLFYDEVRKQFGSDETVLVVVGAEDIFTEVHLKAIRRMTDRIGDIQGVHHVVSLLNAIELRGVEGDLDIAPFISEVPSDSFELERLRARALANPIFSGNLISRDGKAAALLIYFMNFSDSEFMESGIDEEITRIVAEERGDAESWITGTPHLKVIQVRMLLSDLARNLPLILVVGMIVLAFSFRTWRGVLLPAVTVTAALIWTMGIAAWIGRPLNLVTVLVPPLIMILGLAYAVHVVSEFYDTLREDADLNSAEITKLAISKVSLPVLLTGLTTAAGFLALVLSPMLPIREFGLLSLIGILITVVASLSITPALLSVMGRPRLGRAGREDTFDRFAGWAAEFNLRHRTHIFIAFGGIALVALVASTRIQIGTQHIDSFRKDARARIDFETINERLDGANSFNVVPPRPVAHPARRRSGIRAPFGSFQKSRA